MSTSIENKQQEIIDEFAVYDDWIRGSETSEDRA